MTTKTLFTFFLLLIFSLPSFLNGQTNEEQLHDRYWSYRERFRKYFTSIGEKPGQGLVFADVSLQTSFWAHEITSDNPMDLYGKLNIGGDVNVIMADYIGSANPSFIIHNS